MSWKDEYAKKKPKNNSNLSFFVGKFKGTCRKCSKYSHKGEDCWSKSKDPTKEKEKEKKGKKDMGKVKCFNCKKTGHYDRDCTQPKKDEKESFFSFCIVGQETKEEATMSGCAFCKTDFNEHVASRCSNNVRVKNQAEAEASVGQTRKWDGQVNS